MFSSKSLLALLWLATALSLVAMPSVVLLIVHSLFYTIDSPIQFELLRIGLGFVGVVMLFCFASVLKTDPFSKAD